MISGHELIRSEGILRNARGEERPIIKTVVPVQLGGRSYLLESFIDITERKRAEEALLASEKRFHALAEMLPQNIWECDNRGNVTFVNHRGCEMYGYTLEDVEKGMTIWQTIHPDDREQVIGDFIQALGREPGEFPEFHEFMSIRKDGSTFPLITYHLPIVQENKITGMRGIGIDITDRKRAEVALKESEERVPSSRRECTVWYCFYHRPEERSSMPIRHLKRYAATRGKNFRISPPGAKGSFLILNTGKKYSAHG